jgi:hypothetical protein
MKGITKMGLQENKKDKYFKIDVEAHLSGDKTHISYYPGVQLWWRGVDGTQSEKKQNKKLRKRTGL